MQYVEYGGTHDNQLTLDMIVDARGPARVNLRDLDTNGWACRVFEIARDETTYGTLIYVPDVRTIQLFKELNPL
jgi:hypothetical protein